MMTRILILTLLALTVLTGCRPKGEVVRYMARPPASVVRAPADGTYMLYPGVDDPPILVEDLNAGDPVGFTLEKTPAGARLYAVVGQDRSFNLERGERYAWMLQQNMDRRAMPTNVQGSSPTDQRLEAAQRAYEAAEQQLKTAQANYEAAQRRLEQAQQQQQK
jgi:hypothetical protein